MCNENTEFRDAQLFRLLRRCGHVLYHQTHHSQQDAVLHLLEEKGTINQQLIQDQLGIKAGSASELISKLESKALLERKKYEHDRRKVVLSLTERGKIAARIHAERPQENLFSVLSEEEKEQLIGLLQKLHSGWGI